MNNLISLYQEFDENVRINLDKSNFKTRRADGNGLWVGLLLPACLCASLLRFQTSHLFSIMTCCSVGICVSSIFYIFTLSAKKKSFNYLNILLSTIISTSLLSTLLEKDILFALFGGLFTSVSFEHMLPLLLKNFPLSFTLGEALLVVQSIVLFLFSTVVNMFCSWAITPVNDHDVITLILQVGLLSVILIVGTLWHQKSNMNLKLFFSIVGIYLFLMLVFLHIILKTSALVWIIVFLFSETTRLKIVSIWASLSGFGGLTVLGQIFSGEKASTSRRKVFHILASIVYLSGLIYECDMIYLASGIALSVLIALETVRILKIGDFSIYLNEGFCLFADEKDEGGISLTPLYLLIGLSCPLVLRSDSCSPSALLTAISGILSVGIGDTAASYIGSRFGKTRWPGTKKSIIGTAANISSQLITLLLLNIFGFIDTGIWSTCIYIAATLINSMVEAKTDQVDNLTLPFITFLVLVFA